MNIRNPLEANNWDIGTFFRLIVPILLSVWLLLGLDAAAAKFIKQRPVWTMC